MDIFDILKSIALPAALTVGGMVLKNSAEKKAAKQQRQILSTMDMLKNQTQSRNVAATQNAVQQYTPERRMPTIDTAERRLTQQFTRDAAAPDAVGIGPVYSGNVSGDFMAAKAQRKADELRYATKLASLMGRAAAPADVALTEGINNQNAALTRATNNSNLRGDLDVQQLALNAVEPDAGKYMAGDFLTSAGLRLGTPRPIRWAAPAGGAAASGSFGAKK